MRLNPQFLFANLTQGFIDITQQLLKPCFEILGKSPCPYAILGLGSLARGEMNPYSDLEFAIVIKKATEENLDYFRRLTRLLELQIISLNETKFSLLNQGSVSPTPTGFSLDSGGNTPLGKEGLFELIGTAEQLAKFQEMSWFGQDLITSNVLKTVRYIDGDKKLVEEYEKAVSKILDQPLTLPTSKLNPFNKQGVTVRQEQALQLLEGDIAEYQPNLGNQRKLQGCFNIKAEFYRLPNSVLQELCLFYGIAEKGTWERLNTLQKKKLLSQEGYKQLSKLFDEVLQFRMRAHLFYQMEDETLYNFQAQKNNTVENEKKFELSFKERNQLEEVHKILLPLLRVTQQFVEQKGKVPCFWEEKTFYDKSLLEQARDIEFSNETPHAIEMYRKALSLNPNDTNALTELGKIEVKETGKEDPISQLIKALDVLKRLHGEDSEQVANQYNELGVVYNDIGKFQEAIDYHERAVKTYRMLDGQISTRVAKSYRYLGHVYRSEGQYAQAEEYYKKELRNYELCNAPVSSIVENYDILYAFYHAQKRFTDAQQIELRKIKIQEIQSERIEEEEPFEEAEQIINMIGVDFSLADSKVEGDKKAKQFIEKGELYSRKDDIVKAEESYTAALQILKQLHGENDEEVANVYSYLAILCSKQKNQNKTIFYCNKALDIYLNNDFYNNDSFISREEKELNQNLQLSNLEILYNALAEAYLDIKKFSETIEIYEKILEIYAKLKDKKSLQTASVYRSLGIAYQHCNNFKEAIKWFKKALTIYKKQQGEKHVDVAYIYSCIGETYRKRGRVKKAIEYQKKALKIDRLTLG